MSKNNKMTLEEIKKAKREAWHNYEYKVVTGIYEATFYDGWEKAVKFLSHEMGNIEKQQIEISDEEIEKAMLDRSGMWDDPLCFEIGWKDAIKWYREQLKKKI